MSKEVKYVQPLLFPPHLTYLHPQPSNHILTEVQNWSSRNILYDHNLPLQDALVHFLQPPPPAPIPPKKVNTNFYTRDAVFAFL